MNKSFVLSLIAIATIQAAEPMVPESMSTDRGGVKSAIDAYSDGGGVYLYDEKGRPAYDNFPMNSLVFKYGAAAKDSSASLRDQVKTLSQSTAEEKILADKIQTSIITNVVPQTSEGTIFESTATNLKNKADFSYKLIKAYWSQTGGGLFDSVSIESSHTSNYSFYWGYAAPTVFDEIEITVNQTFRIWRGGYTDFPSFRGRLQILQYSNGNWVDVSSYHLSNVYYQSDGPISGKYELFTTEMPAGTYRFKAIQGQYRIDTEWFIEKKI